MQVSVISETAASVVWHPPRSLNGIVLRYHINLYKLLKGGGKTVMKSWELEADEELNVQVFNLGIIVIMCRLLINFIDFHNYVCRTICAF